MRTLALICVLALAACATPPKPALAPTQSIAAQASGGIVAIGTLAPFGSWEFELAPSYTRGASIRALAAARLRSGKIHSNIAVNVQAICDEARKQLDAAARETDNGQPTPAAREKLETVKRVLAAAAQMLEPKQ